MAQRYADNAARERMAAGKCPECGEPPSSHTGWGGPRGCTLTDGGVAERIGQYRADQGEEFNAKDYAATHSIACMHADEHGQFSHVLAPGEKCDRGKP